MDAPQAKDCPGKREANCDNHVALAARDYCRESQPAGISKSPTYQVPRSSTGPTPEKTPACARSGSSERCLHRPERGIGNTMRCSEYCVSSSLRRSGPSRAPRRIGLRQVR